jgi:mannose-6-phosphate isomerase-like protein (cupin superfamily)
LQKVRIEVIDVDALTYEKKGYLHEPFRLFHLDTALTEDTSFHYHEFHKIVLFLSGKGNYLVGGRSYALRPNDVILVERGAIHKAEISQDRRYERIILYIAPEFLFSQSSEQTDLEYCFHTAAQNKSYVIRPDIDLRDAMMRTISALEDASASPEFGQDLLAKSLLIQLLIELGRGMESERYRYAAAENSSEKTAEILEYLQDHLTEDISIDHLAEVFYLSKYHMMRMFRSRTGFTIHGYLTDKRLHFAIDTGKWRQL